MQKITVWNLLLFTQARLSQVGSIAYIDVQDGDHAGHIRCSDASSAAKIVEAEMPGSSLHLLTGLLQLVGLLHRHFSWFVNKNYVFCISLLIYDHLSRLFARLGLKVIRA